MIVHKSSCRIGKTDGKCVMNSHSCFEDGNIEWEVAAMGGGGSLSVQIDYGPGVQEVWGESGLRRIGYAAPVKLLNQRRVSVVYW